MKFPQIREFRPFSTSPEKLITEVAKFLTVDLTRTFKDMMVAFRNLTFDDNFDSFTTTVTIPASTTDFQVRNALASGLIPTQRIIVRGGAGAENIVDGTTEWDQNFVYLANTGGTQVEVTVVFISGR